MKKFLIKKKINTSVVVIFIGVSIAIFHTIRVRKIANEKDRAFYKNFNESFAGRVVKIKAYIMNDDIQVGRGPKFNAYYLNLRRSTITDYDPRDSTFDIYCIIKGSSAIVFEEISTFPKKHIDIGDILYYNGKTDSMFNYKVFNRDTNFKIDKRAFYAKKRVPILINAWQPSEIYNGNRVNLVKSIDDF